MTVIDPGGAAAAPSGMVARIVALLTSSPTEWKKIEPEPATVQGLFTGWLIPLALIPVIASVFHMVVQGGGLPGIAVVKLPLLTALIMGVSQFVLLLAMTYVMGLIINALAPNFGGTQNPIQAQKVAVYSATAACVAGVLQIIPFLGVLAIVGIIVSIFIMHNGLPVLMKSPVEKTFGYTLSVTGVMFVLWLVAGAIMGAVTGPLMASAALQGANVSIDGGKDRGSVKIGGTTIDVGALEKAAKEMEARSEAIQNGGSVEINGATVAAIDPEQLKALLPASLPGGFSRTEISSGSAGAIGMGVANVEGTYTNGDKSINLTVTDMNAMGAIAGMAGAFGVQSSTENADGFERVRNVDGRLTMEKLSRSGRTASYGVMVASRFMLQAEGSNVSIEDVKAATNAVGVARLEALAK